MRNTILLASLVGISFVFSLSCAGGEDADKKPGKGGSGGFDYGGSGGLEFGGSGGTQYGGSGGSDGGSGGKGGASGSGGEGATGAVHGDDGGGVPEGGPKAGSCKGYCGFDNPIPGSDPECYCDDACTSAGDCCGDFD